MKINVLLAAYDEKEAIPVLLENLARTSKTSNLSLSVIVIDDGSQDGTRNELDELLRRGHDQYVKGGVGGEKSQDHNSMSGFITFEKELGFENLPVTVLFHEKNEGLGRALKTGFEYLLPKLRDEDIIITMDADNTHSPEVILLLLGALDSGAGVSIASRYVSGGGVMGLSNSRKFLSWGARRILSIFVPIKGVSDYTCGYRAYRVQFLRKRHAIESITQTGFSVQLEILLSLAGKGVRFKEVPLMLRYDKKKGRSKLKIFQTIVSTIKVLLHHRLVRS